MSTTREEAIRAVKGAGAEVSSQQGIVKRMTRKTLDPVRFTIPGGKHLMEQIDEKSLKGAVYTWLRFCSDFTEVTLSLAQDPDKYTNKLVKVQDFNNPTKDAPWLRPQGKNWLADQLAGRLIELDDVVSLTAKADGIYAVRIGKTYSEADATDWEPHLVFTPRNRPEYRHDPK